ncbi:MAG TPA: hypothetical protein EYN67_16880 [Flavobacteriales bacterium]|nr:hypothetical protein [Methylococcaceae bacterium]HHZ97176.1 hypothetical protein [Flavobacteriales bacterium]
MKEFLGVTGVFILIALLCCISPLIVLWSINTIAEESGAALYIPHTVWNYICTFLLVVILRGGSSSK